MALLKLDKALTCGAHHVGLTVPDVEEATAFFVDALGFQPVGEVPEYPARFVSDGTTMITLWQAESPLTAAPFDRRNTIGLHHLALTVRNGMELEELEQLLGVRDDVAFEFGPEPLLGGPMRHMMCVIAGAIRVEFVAPGS